MLPCADCEGIANVTVSEKDGTWVRNERYQGVREEPSSFASYGTSPRGTADKSGVNRQQWREIVHARRAMRWRVLDREGNPVALQLNYTLAPVTASLPVTPMPLRGACMRYTGPMRDLTDCATGKNGPGRQ